MKIALLILAFLVAVAIFMNDWRELKNNLNTPGPTLLDRMYKK